MGEHLVDAQVGLVKEEEVDVFELQVVFNKRFLHHFGHATDGVGENFFSVHLWIVHLLFEVLGVHAIGADV